jgi:Ca2+-binding RTX toxin-like protein
MARRTTSGDDRVTGSGRADTLNGGAGNDTLTGGEGEDTFVLALGGGDDVVADFTFGLKGVSGYSHDSILFSGFGNFVNRYGENHPDAFVLWDGMQFTTTAGHVLTVTDIGSDTLLSWDTGDSLLVQGVEPTEIHGAWIFSG